MHETSALLTPLDIAGLHYSIEAALLFLEFFHDNFDIIIDVFE